MKVISESGNLRTVRFASPEFQLEANQLILKVWEAKQVKQADGAWESVPGSEKYITAFPVHDGVKVNTATLEVVTEGGAPAYSFIMASTPESLGMTALGGSIYAAIATQVETFLEVNGVM
jgi:hypothetical protein